MTPASSPPTRSRKREEFEEEALEHLELLYGQGLRLTGGDDARADDLVQKTMLKAWRSWDTYDLGTNCKAWLMTILRNTFINEFRKKKSRPEPVDYDDIESRPVWSQLREAGPAEEFFDSILDDEVVRAVENLPDEFRIPVVLSDVQGMSYEEIAEQLKIPLGTLKSRLYRARQRLQEELFEYARSMGYLTGEIDD